MKKNTKVNQYMYLLLFVLENLADSPQVLSKRKKNVIVDSQPPYAGLLLRMPLH